MPYSRSVMQLASAGLFLLGLGAYFLIGLIPKDKYEAKIRREQPLFWRFFEIGLGLVLMSAGGVILLMVYR